MESKTREFTLLTQGLDVELDALGIVLTVLNELPYDTQARVIRYVQERLRPTIEPTAYAQSQLAAAAKYAPSTADLRSMLNNWKP